MRQVWRATKNRPVLIVGLVILGLGVGAAIWGTSADPDRNTFFDAAMAFYANASTELLSIAITVLIIEILNERRAVRDRKEGLILQMGSPDNSFAVEAVRVLRAHGWLEDGSLQGAMLSGADLQGANLKSAMLSGASLHGANLERADLSEANLENANLTMANLQRATLFRAKVCEANLVKANLRDAALHGADLEATRTAYAEFHGADLEEAYLKGARNLENQLRHVNHLRGATMPDGTRYDGRFSLAGDTLHINLEGIDKRDDAAIARWYEVSEDDYRRGQEWAEINLPKLQKEADDKDGSETENAD